MGQPGQAIHSAFAKLHLATDDGPSQPTPGQVSALRAAYAKCAQDHVFTFWDDLSTEEQTQLFQQLASIDPARVQSIAETVFNSFPLSQQYEILPPPEAACASTLDATPEQLNQWRQSGLEAIAQGEVAVLLMAGGQGTRLGSSAPKGCYNIGLPSHKSLFQLQAERLLKLQELAAESFGDPKKETAIPWYIMTSGPTRKDTEEFLRAHKFFGLKPENVMIFEQGVLPCLTHEGKIIMEDKHKVAVAPDGNGGLYLALLTSSVLADLQRRGIQHIHAYCVDNCLVRIADPVFIGYSVSKNLDIATKVVRKRSPDEPVGLVVLKNSKPGVIEYSEVSKRETEATEASSSTGKQLLKYRAANIVNHYYSMRFLSCAGNWATSLPHHIAKKKIPCIDLATGEKIKPQSPNGIKLEQFVFDVFDLVPLEKFGVFEVDRREEFSPLKNGQGSKEDNPDTSRRDVLLQGRRWIEAAGGCVLDDGDRDAGIEISPLVSYAGEGLEFVNGKEVKAPGIIADKRCLD